MRSSDRSDDYYDIIDEWMIADIIFVWRPIGAQQNSVQASSHLRCQVKMDCVQAVSTIYRKVCFKCTQR